MRRLSIAALMIALLLLAGCGQGKRNESEFLTFRELLLSAESVAATGEITADYGGETASYTLRCVMSGEEYEITVLAPESVAGVTARTDGDSLDLEYDGAILAAGELGPDGLTPVSALPALIEALEAGHVELLWREGDRLAAELLTGESSTLRVSFAEDGAPVYFEALSEGRAVLFCSLTEFTAEK